MSDTEYPKVITAEDFNNILVNLYFIVNAIKLTFILEETPTLITNII